MCLLSPVNYCRLMNNVKSKPVRDLVFAIYGPDLIKPGHIDPTTAQPVRIEFSAETAHWLDHIDRHPELLTDKMGNSRKLGLYFEDLWGFFLANAPGYELLARNFKVIENRKTLGELDFVYRFRTKITHLETAVKFYLGGSEHHNDPFSWIGPGRKDLLGLKLERMTSHQLPVSSLVSEEFVGNAVDLNRAYCIRGLLFSHINKSLWPDFYSIESGRAKWLRYSEINDLGNLAAQPLTKLEWMTQPVTKPTESLAKILAEQDCERFEPTLFYVPELSKLSIDTRLFVVPDDWGLNE